jgi:hypothetical protein
LFFWQFLHPLIRSAEQTGSGWCRCSMDGWKGVSSERYAVLPSLWTASAGQVYQGAGHDLAPGTCSLCWLWSTDRGSAFPGCAGQAQQTPRCAYCGQPVVSLSPQSAGKTYHTSCYHEHVVTRCIYCQQPLLGQYLVDARGNAYCPHHQTHYPHCSFCRRLIPPAQQTAGWNVYGSERCAVCRSTAIAAIEQALPHFQQCKRWIARQGFRFA